MPEFFRRRAAPIGIVTTLCLAAGIALSCPAQAQDTGARIVDPQAMTGTDADVGPIQPNHAAPCSKKLVKTLLKTPNGTVMVRAGDSPKRYRAETDEVWYVVSGTAKALVGDSYRDLQPGDALIIPKGTNRAGSHAGQGDIKVLSAELPPQAEDDFHRVQ